MKMLPFFLLLVLVVGCGPEAVSPSPQPKEQTDELPNGGKKGGAQKADPVEFVTGAVFSPDNRLVLISFTCKTGGYKFPAQPRGLALWEVASGKLLWVAQGAQFGPKGKDFRLTPVGFLPGGKLALVCGGHSLQVWNVQEGKPVREFATFRTWLDQVALSADGRLALAYDGTALNLWDVTTGQHRRTFGPVPELPETILFSPDGKFALSAHRQQTVAVILWDVSTGKPIRSFPSADGWSRPTMFVSNGKSALIGKIDRKQQTGSLIFWEVPTGKIIREFNNFRGGPLAFSPDGKHLFVNINSGSGLKKPTIQICDAATGALIQRHPFEGGLLMFSNDRRMVFEAYTEFVRDINFKVWVVATGEVVKTTKVEGRVP